MLLTNQRLNKLSALHMKLASIGLAALGHPPPPGMFDSHEADNDDVDDCIIADVQLAATPGTLILAFTYTSLMLTLEPAKKYPHSLSCLADTIKIPEFPDLVRRFLYDQLCGDNEPPSENVALNVCPKITARVYVFHSAIACFYTPSNTSGIWGMKRERIRSTPSWHGHSRRDCALVVTNADQEGFRGMDVIWIFLFFSFTYHDRTFLCALVQWFTKHETLPNPRTGMWIVKPNRYLGGRAVYSIVHLNMILRSSHLLLVFGSQPVSHHLKFYHTVLFQPHIRIMDHGSS